MEYLLLSVFEYSFDSGQPVEAFFVLSDLSQTTAEAIDTTFERAANIDVSKMVACSFDGGANYTGCRAGVQALLRQSNPSICFMCEGLRWFMVFVME